MCVSVSWEPFLSLSLRFVIIHSVYPCIVCVYCMPVSSGCHHRLVCERKCQPEKLKWARRRLLIIHKIENFWISCDSNDIWQHFVLELNNKISNANGVRAPYLYTKWKAKGKNYARLALASSSVGSSTGSAYIFPFNVILHLLFI